ncbi:MAG TPA: AAA family ATPase, partial [Caldisericia bacterium]|nr:AAA family ATPase [Caldisericia bacterium]
MLKNLTVKNFAIIEDLSVEFEKGLNVITGETGSGKSILITALGVALGNKFSKDMLREGEDKSILTVTFDISENKRLKKYLIDKGIDDDILFFQREITKDGKQKLKINGMVLPYSIYREIGEVLVDIHGQHEPQSLLDKNKHLELLDRFIGDDFLLKRDEFSKKLTRYKEITNEIEEILTKKEERERRRDYLTFVINEIEKENISEEEEKELLSKREILKNVSKLKETYNEIFQDLEGFDENEGAVDKITKSIKKLDNIETIDKLSSKFKNELSEIEIKISEILNQIKIRKEEIEYSPDELEIIEERLKIYDDLKRKYGKDVQEVINFLEESKKELKNLDISFERVEELKKEKEILENELIEIGKYLRERRVKKAKELGKYIE